MTSEDNSNFFFENTSLGEVSTGLSQGVGGGHPYQNVGQEIKISLDFFKHPIKNILTIWRLKKFLEGPVGGVGGVRPVDTAPG